MIPRRNNIGGKMEKEEIYDESYESWRVPLWKIVVTNEIILALREIKGEIKKSNEYPNYQFYTYTHMIFPYLDEDLEIFKSIIFEYLKENKLSLKNLEEIIDLSIEYQQTQTYLFLTEIRFKEFKNREIEFDL